jgi:hypothetical protein
MKCDTSLSFSCKGVKKQTMIGVPPQHAGRRPKSVGALFGFFLAKNAHFSINYD